MKAIRVVFPFLILMCGIAVNAQIKPPGFDREMQLKAERDKMSPLDRDSITITDTIVVFDPSTYQESVDVIQTRYSIRDFARNVYGIGDADKLLDGKPHVIIDPRTYEEIRIRLTPSGRIEELPKE